MYDNFICNGYIFTHNLVGPGHTSIFHETLMASFSLLVIATRHGMMPMTMMTAMNMTAATWLMMMIVMETMTVP
jgi:hypothetical protein